MSSRFNWQEVKTYFLSDERISYGDLCAKFGMSTTAIKKYQKTHNENWHKLREETIQKVAQKLPDLLVENLTEIKLRHIKEARIMQELGIKLLPQIDLKSPRSVISLLKSGVLIERLALGLNSK